MWVPKWYWDVITRQIDELERRVKRLELIILKDAENKITGLQKRKPGDTIDDYLPIEEIVERKYIRDKK